MENSEQRQRSRKTAVRDMRLVWFLVCGIVCFIHAALLTSQYMAYDMSTEVKITYRDTLDLPDITMCSRLIQLANWENERLKSVCKYLTGIKDCEQLLPAQIRDQVSILYTRVLNHASVKMLSMFTIHDLLNNLTVKVDDWLASHKRYRNSQPTAIKNKAEDSFRVHHFVQTMYKCFTLSFKPELNQHDYWDLKRQTDYFAILRMNHTIAKPITNGYWGYTDNRKEKVIYVYAHFVALSLSDSMTITDYDRYESSLLPAPFASNCMDYKASSFGKYESRGDCFESCYAEKAIAKFASWPLLTRQDDHDSQLKCMDAATLVEHKQELLRMLSDCKSTCSRQDCDQQVYETMSKSAFMNVSRSEQAHGCKLPSSPVIVSQCSAKVTFASFATDVCSALGFWLGVSALTLMQSAEMMVRGVTSHHREKGDGNRTLLRKREADRKKKKTKPI